MLVRRGKGRVDHLSICKAGCIDVFDISHQEASLSTFSHGIMVLPTTAHTLCFFSNVMRQYTVVMSYTSKGGFNNIKLINTPLEAYGTRSFQHDWIV